MVRTRSASATLMRWLAPQVSPFQPLRVTMPCMPISGANGPGLKSEPAAAVMPGIREGAIGHRATHELLAVEAAFVGVVVAVGRERRQHPGGLDAPEQIVSDQRAMGDFRARVGPREEPLRPLKGREHHVDGDIAVGVAIDLDAGAVDTLDPGIELILLEDEIAPIRRL